MHPVRIFRILLPILILGFIVAMALTFRGHAPRRVVPADVSPDQSARMEGFKFSDLVGGRRRFLVQARVGRVDEKGAFDVEDVQRLEVDREKQGPLVLTAKRGSGSGTQGQRVVHLDGGVTMNDDTGFGLAIPAVDVDQVQGEVRSVGEVALTGEGWSGTAAEIVYGLNGQPTLIRNLALTSTAGGHLAADNGSMPAASQTLTLTGNVHASQAGMDLAAGTVVVVRNAGGRLQSLSALPEVQGRALLGGTPASFSSREAKAEWTPEGEIREVHLSGDVKLDHAHGTLSAGSVDATAVPPAGSFLLHAATLVNASGPTPKGKAELTCDALHAVLGPKGTVTDGVAQGSVRFDGEATAGEAAEARITSLGPDGTVTLRASDERRARLASGRTRIVADTIVSDVRGTKLRADGRVESTLLPQESRPTGSSPMFQANEAVHFVSNSLDSLNSGAHLLLHGEVRGWQGERTLAADEVEMIQAGEILNATGSVATRMPREAARATSDADYVQVGADSLAYRGAAHVADYDGSVRVRQAEGWLETPHLTASLVPDGPGIRQVEAQKGVRFEYRAAGDKGVPSTSTGEGDRAVYEPASRTLRVFGDKSPATVRSTGPNAGTTVGRVLRYALDTGALDVESGERDRATIQTPKK